MAKKKAAKKKTAKRKAASKTRRAGGTRRKSPTYNFVVAIVMDNGAKGALPRSLRRVTRGDKVTFINCTSRERKLVFPSSPFRDGGGETVTLDAQGSPGAIRTKTIHGMTTEGAYGFDVLPPASTSSGPPGEPQVVVGG